MKNVLLSLPPDVVKSLTTAGLEGRYGSVYADSDPTDRKLGSGGGTVWISERFASAHPERREGRDIIVHAGGQSRRLPAYAATGKSLAPLPVLRWAVGDKIDQTLLDLQLPLLEAVVEAAPAGLNTLVASGDVLIRNEGALPAIPEADVVCFGLWADPAQACNHGVFFMPRSEEADSSRLDFMLQKPSTAQLSALGRSHYYLMDIGLWLLSDRAMQRLSAMSKNAADELQYCDLYSHFGCGLGENPSRPDKLTEGLTVAIVPLHNGEFYHFGTTRQLLSSTLALQNLVADQRRILRGATKPNPALFVQNCVMDHRLDSTNNNVWIENSHVASGWQLTQENVVTGVPENDWRLTLHKGVCLDVVPVDNELYAVRPYGYDDAMRGAVSDQATMFQGVPFAEWSSRRGLDMNTFGDEDIQLAPIFPLVADVESMGLLVRWMTSEPELAEGRGLWMNAEKVSAEQIMSRANLQRLFAQREAFLKKDLKLLATNPASVFYQLDLDDTATKMATLHQELPAEAGVDVSVSRRMHNSMLRSRLLQLRGDDSGAQRESEKAFAVMREAILGGIDASRTMPHLSVDRDQIVWGRSPVRIDLAGGWTDTPPYSLLHGGAVVNMAVELNGQPPLQVFVKPSAKPHIILRSIDLGASEVISDYASLTDYARVGSPFSLPKAALAIAGFAPGLSSGRYVSLEQQLREFGSGIEITLLSALPAGSGMGTSSILGATILGALSDFCGLGWTSDEICVRTLAMEQMLTTGGGWQDQYGGVLQGVKLLQTTAGWQQTPAVSWLPDGLFTDSLYAPCHMLFYTGITRTAKGILAEIVKRMFLNHGQSLHLLSHMKEHALAMASAIQRRDFGGFGALVGKSWEQNQLLDSGTCPPEVERIVRLVSDLSLGLKLPGAGGGGYLYIVAKDPEAAARIRTVLSEQPRGRFAEMSVSNSGLQVSRS